MFLAFFVEIGNTYNFKKRNYLYKGKLAPGAKLQCLYSTFTARAKLF